TQSHDDGNETRAFFHASWDAIKREKIPSTAESNAPEDPHHDAEEHGWFEVAGSDQDGGHLCVRRLEPDVSPLGVVVLDGGFVADERDDDVAPLGGELLFDEDVVTAKNAGVDHRIAGDLEAEDLAAAAHERAIDADRVEHIFLGQKRQP